MSKEQSQPASPTVDTGFKKKNIIVVGLVFAGLWTLAIASGSIIFMSVAGVLTLLAAGFGFWAWRMIRRHKKLAGVLQGAGDSPEARRKALAKLEADKNSGDLTNVIARAQLMASDEPAKALALLEPIDLKTVPAGTQDDFALLKSQLLLNFGRAKQARPLADMINVDNPQRKEVRPFMVAIVGETWARTGSAKEANTLLDTIKPADIVGSDAAPILLMARVYAQFAAGKKGLTRNALNELAAMDPNLLGRFIAPKSQVHPGLQRLARETFERKGSRQRQRGNAGPGGRR
ncbi:MAG: hypothetical protein JKY56_12005 [Kofleriaceae bacterium]|nr:hypothetical protein [Kofleriaceae bacterium]